MIKSLSIAHLQPLFWQKLNRLLFMRGQQQAFLEDLTSLIDDGVPANQAIATIADITQGAVKQVAQDIMQKLAEGKSIADGMQDWFPQTIIEIIRAGEDGGTLVENLKAAARTLTQKGSVLSSLLSATLYPLTVITMALVVTVYIKHSVFNNFLLIKPVVQWPEIGRNLLALANFIEHSWWLVILALIIGGMALFKMFTSFTGAMRHTFDNIPGLSLYREVTAASFMEVLGLLLSNGIILRKALGILKRKANPYLAWHIFLMEYRLSGGRDNIADVIDTGLIQKADIVRLRIIAQGKGFAHALVRLGKLAAAKNEKKLQLAAKLVGAILLIIGAALAAFMVFAIYSVGSFVGT